MKNKILCLLIISGLLLTACVVDEDNSSAKSSSDGSDETSLSEVESSFVVESVESVYSIESTESTESQEISESTESTEVLESEESIESTDSSESTESIDNSEENSSLPTESQDEPSSEEDSSYEIMDTPVIDVPDELKSAEEDSFFNDSIFVGNSIMLGYSKFANTQRAGSIPDFLGTAYFFTAGNWGVYHNNRTPASSSKAYNPSYQGKKYSVEDVVGVAGAKRVFINFMGLNDLALYGDAKNCSRKCADDVIKLIEKINSMYPDVEVVILSATYITASRNKYPSLNNKNLSMMNNYLLEYCNEKGLDFVDIASQLTEKGCLADKYASDGYCHIWTAGYKVWTAILRDYAVRKINGTYKNPEKMPILGINK